ncbi:hypothetical protein [Frigidibacter sp.]|uniref:hypothetical protein n=1 Tax=Frigidibacter sp. TaxID=2586418 RepID=UPI00273596C3|nr:hypothetical protein [Frigidibacter sp.]MDP3340588.1 hypothetical protein [Frigidibacter sp.]
MRVAEQVLRRLAVDLLEAPPAAGMRARRARAQRDGIDIQGSLLNDLRTLRAA